MKKVIRFTLVGVAMALSHSAFAQFAKAEDAINYRKSALFVMAQNFGRVAGMANGKIPFNAKVATESAANAEYVSKLPWAGFGSGTDQGETKAKPEIWSNMVKFDEYAGKMQVEMTKLAAAARTGNMDNIKAAVNATGRTCKSCHDDFKAK